MHGLRFLCYKAKIAFKSVFFLFSWILIFLLRTIFSVVEHPNLNPLYILAPMATKLQGLYKQDAETTEIDIGAEFAQMVQSLGK